MESWDWIEIWQRSRQSWHWPLLPPPVLREEGISSSFVFPNYQITLNQQDLELGPLYLENLFDHLIVQYIFCPRSLENAGLLALAALKGLGHHLPSDSAYTQAYSSAYSLAYTPRGKMSLDRAAHILSARRMVNIFSDIVSDSFRLERSRRDEELVLMGYRRLADRDGQAGCPLMPMDRVILGFLRAFWGADLPPCPLPEVEHLLRIFSPGIRDRSLWPRQCQEMARILGALEPGVLGQGPVRAQEILNGSADAVPLLCASGLDAGEYEEARAVLGQRGDLKRWYRDQSYFIEIRELPRARYETCPSDYTKWRLTDPFSDLDISYSLSLSPYLIPGVSTYRRRHQSNPLIPGRAGVPDLLVVLDSSRSMEGPRKGTRTHKATLAAFKACQFAHSMGAELAAINFSESYHSIDWTRDLNAVEDVLVEFFCTRTHIPGNRIRELAWARPGCLILCITDTHIQNLYQEWEDIKKAAEVGSFVLFSIDPAYRDKHVEEALSSLGQVYHIRQLDDLISLVVEVSERAYSGESFIISQ
ncbi:MAG: VWA domain-containing protein [Methanothrix sp.]|jgi:hypothetical protein